MTAPNELSIVRATAALRDRSLTAEALLDACLARIDAREDTVKAWVEIDRDAARADARGCDQDAARDSWRGPLHGIPIGIKDIFDVQGMPTRAGTDAWPISHPERDAASVARLRHAGAIILGKTVTTAFAMGDAGPTTNPWNSSRTPGGSSSGSAAAVADRMCLAALGSQTSGSVIRPCAFNGIAGLKPGHGRVDTRGVLPLSWRLDHVGALTRNVADAGIIWQVLRDDVDWRDRATFDQTLSPPSPERPMRLWRPRGMFESEATEAVNRMFENHIDLLKSRKIEIVDRDLPDGFDQILDQHTAIMTSEAAAAHHENFDANGASYPPNIRENVEAGREVSAVEYIEARQHRRMMIERFARELVDLDGIIFPAATEAAPEGLSYTGKRTFNAPTSYLGLPVVSYPTALDNDGMPLAVQIMGSLNREDDLLSISSWCDELAGFKKMPAA